MNINYKLVGGIVGGLAAAAGGTVAVKKYLERRKAQKAAAEAKAKEAAAAEATKKAEVEAAASAKAAAESAAAAQAAARQAEMDGLAKENLRLQNEMHKKTLDMLNQFAGLAEVAMGELQSELDRKAARREAAASAEVAAAPTKAARPSKKKVSSPEPTATKPMVTREVVEAVA